MKAPSTAVVASFFDSDILSAPFMRLDEMLEKKKRNLQKRIQRLQQLDEEEKSGKTLTEEQLEARSRLPEVEQQFDFAKEVQKLIAQQTREYNRAVKERDAIVAKELTERNRASVELLMHYQEIVNLLVQRQPIRKAFHHGYHGALKLTEEQVLVLDKLDALLMLTMESVKTHDEWMKALSDTSSTVSKLLFGSKETIFDGVTGADAKKLLEEIKECEYFVQHKVVSIPTKKDKKEKTAKNNKEREEIKKAEEKEPVRVPTPKVTFLNPRLNTPSNALVVEFGADPTPEEDSLSSSTDSPQPQCPQSSPTFGESPVEPIEPLNMQSPPQQIQEVSSTVPDVSPKSTVDAPISPSSEDKAATLALSKKDGGPKHKNNGERRPRPPRTQNGGGFKENGHSKENSKEGGQNGVVHKEHHVRFAKHAHNKENGHFAEGGQTNGYRRSNGGGGFHNNGGGYRGDRGYSRRSEPPRCGFQFAE